MVSVTMTTVRKKQDLGGLQPRVMRDGVKHTRVAGVLFWNFHARLLNTGRLLAPNIWGQYSKKNRRV